MKIVTVEEMQELERRSEASGVTTNALMEQAGLAVARIAWRRLETVTEASVLALTGPGNNGGDGLVAARHLRAWGATVTAYLCAARRPEDPKLRLARDADVRVIDAIEQGGLAGLREELSKTHLVVDAILGTGRARRIQGALQEILSAVQEERARRSGLMLLALDLPTGLNADTGEADPACLAADLTVTLGCPKKGLFRFPGAEKVGRLMVADIGIPGHLLESPSPELVTPRWVREHLPARPLNAHKGTFGRVLVVAGSHNFIGAAYLACMGAARTGTGYVTLATLPSIQPILATKLTEATYVLLPEDAPGDFGAQAGGEVRQAMEDYDALLMGCGLGQRPATQSMVRQALLSTTPLPAPLVLDADALNTLARTPEWWKRLKGEVVLTPHPGEMARLLGGTVEAVEEDRIESARAAAALWGVTVLLKGAFSVVASPQGDVRVLPFANPILASAGTGDVLAGVVAGLLAQGMSPFDAAGAGAFLHGAAGELVARELGDRGAVASDLLPALPQAIKAILEETFSLGVEEEP